MLDAESLEFNLFSIAVSFMALNTVFFYFWSMVLISTNNTFNILYIVQLHISIYHIIISNTFSVWYNCITACINYIHVTFWTQVSFFLTFCSYLISFFSRENISRASERSHSLSVAYYMWQTATKRSLIFSQYFCWVILKVDKEQM